MESVLQTTEYQQMQETKTEPERTYAGFWIRVLAVLLDSIALQAVFLAIKFAFNVSLFSPPVMISLLEYLIAFAYYIILTVKFGQTLGKMIVGIQVVRTNGQPNKWGIIIFREIIGKLVSGLILAIGYIMAGFDAKKRALHDRMAGTYVVKVTR